jgi:hypothetical protein
MLARMRELIKKMIQRDRNIRLVLVLYFLTFWTFALTAIRAQAPPATSDDLFAKYPVAIHFKGKPAPPILTDPATRLYRTRIREGVAKGIAFAGHYEVAVWGCGAGCISFAIVDAVTGKVNFFPATISQNREAGERLTYKRESRALHIIGSLNEEDSADRWYVWNGEKFTLISEKPAVLMDDNGDPIKP